MSEHEGMTKSEPRKTLLVLSSFEHSGFFVIRHSCLVISRLGSLQAPRVLPQLRENRILLHGAYSPLDAKTSMQRSKRLSCRFHERHSLGVPIALRLGMPYVGMRGDDQAEARISSPKAVIVLLPIAAWEPLVVKKPKPTHHFTRDAEAKRAD